MLFWILILEFMVCPLSVEWVILQAAENVASTVHLSTIYVSDHLFTLYLASECFSNKALIILH